MLSTQLANFLKMISFGNAASSHSSLIPLKTSYNKKRGIALGDREAIMAGTYSLKISQKNSWYRETQKYIKNEVASLRCHGDSDCDKTEIIRNFHLYITQLW